MMLFVLAGGFGTRLRSVVADIPKPLAPIDGIPFLHYQIKNWRSQGISSFLFLLHHQAELIIDFLAEEKNGVLEGCNAEFVIESEPLDTGGAVCNAIKTKGYRGSFLVTNADTWLGADIPKVICADSPAIGVVQLDDCSRYGKVLLDGAGKVTAFQEKRENSGPGFINAGIYHLDTSLFDFGHSGRFSLERDFFPGLAKEGRVNTVEMGALFIDIGIPADYQRFKEWAKSNYRESK
jgi:D-glycero-alpha-D-manno-heptose 1-phosphate guanylyltransferase